MSASQALSSETSIGRLHARVAEVLGAMTGATGVHLALWNAEREDWLRPAPGGAGTVPVGSGREEAVPMSVLRYVQRTGEPLVTADATRDDRFARDPYFAAAGCCAVLAVPVASRSVLRGVLVAENRLIRGAFTAGRLDAVQLIAGQLAISMDNAQLYAELTASRARIVAEALTNAARHARATAVTVRAEADGDVLRVTVRDDGADGADFARGTGLGRAEGPRRGDRRPPLPRQPARRRDHLARRTPAHRHHHHHPRHR